MVAECSHGLSVTGFYVLGKPLCSSGVQRPLYIDHFIDMDHVFKIYPIKNEISLIHSFWKWISFWVNLWAKFLQELATRIKSGKADRSQKIVLVGCFPNEICFGFFCPLSSVFRLQRLQKLERQFFGFKKKKKIWITSFIHKWSLWNGSYHKSTFYSSS